MNWLNWLQGKKTYLIMIIGFVFNLGLLTGWWTMDNSVWSFIDGILVFLGIGGIRSGVKSEVAKLQK
jgi:hypothetical protein